MAIELAIHLQCLPFAFAITACRFANKKVINILVGKESIMLNATQPTLITIPVTPIASIRGSSLCK